MVVWKRLMIWRWMIKGFVKIPAFEIDVTYGLGSIRSWFGNDKVVPSNYFRIANIWMHNVRMTYQNISWKINLY